MPQELETTMERALRQLPEQAPAQVPADVFWFAAQVWGTPG